jgi:nucleotide-binding universal stress UspA family protein
VPAGWTTDAHGVVMVGVKSPQHAGGMLADAFAAARRRRARLVVLHAWKLPSVYDDIIEVRVDTEDWQRQATAELDALLRDWRAAYPDVQVETRVVHDHAGHALTEASSTADLLLIVRRGHGAPASTHLGSTARAVLRSAHCPVRVVPPVDVTPIPSLVLEEHGVLTP